MLVAKPASKRKAAIEAHLHVATDRRGFVKCRVCGCTEDRACDPPCSWVDGEADLCTTCGETLLQMRAWFEDCWKPSWRNLMKEAKRLVDEPIQL
jgi:hypothetical protein